MTTTIRVSLAATLVLAATSAFATNGDHLIGLGAKARGMGGVGIAHSFGAESALANPALIRGNEISFGGTAFMPDVKFRNGTDSTALGGGPSQAAFEQSDSGFSMIPEVAISHQVSENLIWGIGIFGVAGMGVDYRDDDPMYGNQFAGDTVSPSGAQNAYAGTESGTNQMLTNLQLMRFALPIAFTTGGLSLGVAPVVQYGSLSIAYNNGAFFYQPDMQGNFIPVNVMTGHGMSYDFGFGIEAGAAFTIEGFTIGTVYRSAIDMEYEDQIKPATEYFGLSGISDHLEQPAEFGVGAAYSLMGHTLAVDWKTIQWAEAKGYKDFGWENQSVIAVGYEYDAGSFALRLGYNYAQSPIKEQEAASIMTQTGAYNQAAYEGAVKNYFNLAGFPAVVESHVTVGGSVSLTDQMSVDLSYQYAPKVTYEYDTSAMTQAQIMSAAMAAGQSVPQTLTQVTSKAEVEHAQSGISFNLNYMF